MEGRASIGRAAEIAGLPVTEFYYIRVHAYLRASFKF